MKGIVFTQLLDMVEQEFGYGLVDTLLITADLPSGGAYTSAGTYHPQEMVSLVTILSKHTNKPVPDVLRDFGRYLFKSFVSTYRHFIVAAPDAFSFLGSVHAYIHVEVKKLYSDAELPFFGIERYDENTLRMVYQSNRKMADLAYGLIEGTLEHYGETATITKNMIKDDGSVVEFIIVKQCKRIPDASLTA
jgi:predicted hydrocarbon binding protein